MEDWVLEFLAYLLAGLAYGIGTLFAEHVYLRFIAPDDDDEEEEEEEEPPKRKRRKAPPNRPPKKRPKDASRKQSGPYGGGFSAP